MPSKRCTMRLLTLIAAPILVTAGLALGSAVARAEPIHLKLAFFASEQSDTFRCGIKPFVDAVNAAGKGLLTIDVYAEGSFSKRVAEQPALVLDGTADIAWIVPGQTPYRFPDNDLLEIPGLFHDVREGTLTYTRLVESGDLRGYQDFFVIGAYTSAPSIIHSRKPIDSLAALKGRKMRTNNAMEAKALSLLGALPTIMAAPRLAAAISKGAVDGGIMSPTGLLQFGAASVARNHYLLQIGAAPLAVLMSRKKFDSLPQAAQAIIRKYSGAWMAATWIKTFGAVEARSLAKLETDPQHHAVTPSPEDRERAERVYQSMRQAWAAKSPRNGVLLDTVATDLAAIRAGQ